jgi:mono/diheme cytochrome c family protein
MGSERFQVISHVTLTPRFKRAGVGRHPTTVQCRPKEIAMKSRVSVFAIVAAVAISASAYTFGGWAVVTVDDLPDYLTVGQPTRIAFAVRQHGMMLMSEVRPEITATDGKITVLGTNPMSSAAGRFAGNLVVPHAGKWTITVNSGWGKSAATLYPVPAIVPGAAPPVPTPVAERGQRLFVAKGCATCHVHGSVEGSGFVKVGPELTPKRYVASFLARFLADPSIQQTPGLQAKMPNLELKPAEISALVAFINSDKQVSVR